MHALKKLVKKYCSLFIYKRQIAPLAYLHLKQKVQAANGKPLSNASANIFTYHGEDGIIEFIFQHLPERQKIFIDIGAGDCIKSNCAVLALHRKWTGVFIDADDSMLNIGRRFYQKLGRGKLQFINGFVTAENINKIIAGAGVNGAIDLLSIDIDGNDYWIWKAVDVVQPAVVVIESKVEFGDRDIVVPYTKKNHHSFDAMYNGASVEALRKLGLQKGYTLIGANVQGYNLFFIQTQKLMPPFVAAQTADLLRHPETANSFYGEQFFQLNQFTK